MGTPDFAKESLQSIYEAGHKIKLVITNQDKPKGRGMKLTPSPVKEFALEKNLLLEQPSYIKNNKELIQKIKQIDPDVICVVAYGKILPKELLDIPKKGAINVHGSLLPKYRGAAPIQWAIINGEKTTGITTMCMNEKMDEGDILLKEEVVIEENENLGELWKRLSKIGGKLLVKTLYELENGTLVPIPQKGEATYAPMLDREMSKIDWENKTANEIKNLVRGLNPIMGVYTFLRQDKIKFWNVEVVTEKEFVDRFQEFEEYKERLSKIAAGTVLYVNEKSGLYIRAKKDIISVIEIQGPNAKKMSIQEYLRGNKIKAVDIFE